jgi:uncharacterized membrane protein (DUF106 family)
MNVLTKLVSMDLAFLQQPPAATVFILLLSTGISLVTSFANLKVVDLDEYRKMMIESSKVRKEMMDAMKSGNQRRISKAQNRQQALMKQQSKMSMNRMKIMLFFMVPFLLIWRVLVGFFGRTTIAYMPFDAPVVGTDLTIGNWYIMCSVTTNIIISRVLGLTFEITPEDS